MRKESQYTTTTPKTRNGKRTLALSQNVLEMLKEEMELQNSYRQLLGDAYKQYDENFIIRYPDGHIPNPNSPNRVINKMADKIGIPHLRIHDIRHCVASILFEGNVPLRNITTQLGHGQTSTTERIYVHRKNVAQTENFDIIASKFGLSC